MYKDIRILEVCPRDGFQNVKTFIPTDKKIEIAKSLMDAGFEEMEMTSFISPKWIPQMADSAEVVSELRKYQKENKLNTFFTVLAPNPKGVENASKCDIDGITYPISVSERHNKENVNRTREQSFKELEELIKKYDNLHFTVGLATVFGSPYLGEKIQIDDIIKMAVKAFEIGANRVVVSDTVGNGNPDFVEEVLETLKDYVDFDRLNMHLHDTFSLSLTNTLIGLKHGIKVFETAAGGLGGCPFAPGAAGNVATEDVLNLFDIMGIKTTVEYNINDLYKAIGLIKKYVDAPIVSHAYKFYECNNAFRAEAK